MKTDGKLMRGAGERGESYFPLACFSDISWSFVEVALISYPNLLFTKPKASLTRELGKRLARRRAKDTYSFQVKHIHDLIRNLQNSLAGHLVGGSLHSFLKVYLCAWWLRADVHHRKNNGNEILEDD